MIKKQICKTGLALLSFMLFAFPVKAADDSVALQVNGNKVEATFQSGAASGAQEEILSLQLSFELTSKDGKPKKNEVSFEFNSAIQSVVAESRYQESTGVLNIYISGSGNILSGDETSLGKVIFTPSTETAQYSVKVVENSLKTVNKAFYMEELPVISPIEGNVVIGGNNGGGSNGGGSGSNGGGGSGSNGSGSGGNHDYDDWYSDEEDSRRPEDNITSNRPPEILVTNPNSPSVVNPGTTPTPVLPPSNNETTPANNQVNNTTDNNTTPAPAENPSGTQNKPSSSGTGSGNGKGTNSSDSNKNENGESNTETSATVEGSNNSISDPKESESMTEGEDITESQTQEPEKNTEASAQPEETQDEEEKSSKLLIWLLVILGIVVVAAAVATGLELLRRSPKGNNKNKKR